MLINIENSKKVAEILLRINAVKLQPSNFFTWSSGKKSPIYCDNRLLLSHVKERNFIGDLFCNYIKQNFPKTDYIAGVATGAIAHGMIVASKLDLPFIYVRDKAKEHGKENQKEGKLKKGRNVIVIEDLISTGKSSINAMNAIRKKNANIISLMSIFTYEIANTEQFKTEHYSLSNYSCLINLASQKNIINNNEKEILTNWKKSLIK